MSKIKLTKELSSNGIDLILTGIDYDKIDCDEMLNLISSIIPMVKNDRYNVASFRFMGVRMNGPKIDRFCSSIGFKYIIEKIFSRMDAGDPIKQVYIWSKKELNYLKSQDRSLRLNVYSGDNENKAFLCSTCAKRIKPIFCESGHYRSICSACLEYTDIHESLFLESEKRTLSNAYETARESRRATYGYKI